METGKQTGKQICRILSRFEKAIQLSLTSYIALTVLVLVFINEKRI